MCVQTRAGGRHGLCVLCGSGCVQEVIKKLPTHLKIVDLSADFRLKDPASYAEW